ncbi:hypothetical protein HPY86_08300 [candidate division WOR-3 bacterium]|nr:hypothetical protein [candidate division WOR-3 bacterium]
MFGAMSSRNPGQAALRRLPLVLIVIFIITGGVFAQDVVWIREFDTGRVDICSGGAVDSLGNAVVVAATMDSDSFNHIGILLIKYSPSGDTLWNWVLDDTAYDEEVFNVAIDRMGNIVVVGLIRFPHRDSSIDGLIIKLDPTGNLLWQRRYRFNNMPQTVLSSVVFDESQNIIAGGHYYDYGLLGGILLMKLSPEGDILWVRDYDLSSNDDTEGFAELVWDRDGNLVGTGEFGSFIEWSFDFFVIKLTPDGDIIWWRRFDANLEDWSTGIAVDTENYIYISGDTGEDPVLPHQGIVMKVSPTGELLWQRLFPQQVPESNFSKLKVHPSGKILTTGGIGFDPYPGPRADSSKCVLVAYTPDGDTIFTRYYRFDTLTSGGYIELFGMNDCYIFGGCGNNIYNFDLFVMKLSLGSGIEETERQPYLSHPLKSKIVHCGQSVPIAVYEPGDYQFTVFDITGRRLKSHSEYLRKGDFLLNTAGIAPGIYLIKVVPLQNTQQVVNFLKLIVVK